MNFEPRFLQKSDEDDSVSTSAPMWRQRRFLIAFGGFFILLMAALIYHNHAASGTPATQDVQIPTVTVMIPGRVMSERVINSTGTLAAKREMPVGVVGEGGMVRDVLVEPGTWVRAGQVLATIERSVQAAQASASAAQIGVAQANARIAQSNLERAQALVARGFISKADVESKQATRDAAYAQVAVARAQMSEASARTHRLDIRAPAAGLVLTRAVEPGQVVSPSTGTLFRIARDGEIELKAQVSESDLAQVQVGAQASVVPVGTQQSFSGHVWQIAPVIDPQTRLGVVRIALPYNAALRPGGFASARLNTGTLNVPLLPESAVMSGDKGSYIYVIDAHNKVEKRAVTIGDVSDRGIAITSGLSGVEQVVVSAGAFLNAGETVSPVRASAAALAPAQP